MFTILPNSRKSVFSAFKTLNNNIAAYRKNYSELIEICNKSEIFKSNTGLSSAITSWRPQKGTDECQVLLLDCINKCQGAFKDNVDKLDRPAFKNLMKCLEAHRRYIISSNIPLGCLKTFAERLVESRKKGDDAAFNANHGAFLKKAGKLKPLSWSKKTPELEHYVNEIFKKEGLQLVGDSAAHAASAAGAKAVSAAAAAAAPAPAESDIARLTAENAALRNRVETLESQMKQVLALMSASGITGSTESSESTGALATVVRGLSTSAAAPAPQTASAPE